VKGLDTNVIVRFLVRDDESQWLRADQYINQALETNQTCLINNIVLANPLMQEVSPTTIIANLWLSWFGYLLVILPRRNEL